MSKPSVLDRMQTDYLMWSAFVGGERRALEAPLTLPAGEWDELAHLTERFAALIERTIDLCLADATLLNWFGFSRPLRQMIEADAPWREPVALARTDFFRTPGGWRVSEFNTDVPGGVHEAQALNDLVARDARGFTVVERLTDIVCRDSARPMVGIIYASGYGDDLEQCQYLRQWWNRRGVRALLGNPENLVFNGRRLLLFDHALDVVYRFFPAEWLEEIDRLAAILDARGACRMINGFSQLVAQTKKVMAFWYEHLERFSPDERALVESHVPRTSLFRAGRLDEILRDRERLVVKRGFGRVGEQVLIGAMCTDEEWREELEWPLSEPGEWIVQERFDVMPQPFDSRVLTQGGALDSPAQGGEALYACYGAYAVGGCFSGLYTRAAKEPFITYDAYTVAVKRDG